jgi:hypothetical protein
VELSGNERSEGRRIVRYETKKKTSEGAKHQNKYISQNIRRHVTRRVGLMFSDIVSRGWIRPVPHFSHFLFSI